MIPAALNTTNLYEHKGVFIVGSKDVFQCLQQGIQLNITTTRLLVNYSHPEPLHHLVPELNNSHDNGHVCWLQVTSPTPDTTLVVDWFTQTCTENSYVIVHEYHDSPHYSQRRRRWKKTQWTGCEYKEDPISALYITTVKSIYVELHLHPKKTAYQVLFGVRAVTRLSMNRPGGKDLEIKHVSSFSGKRCLSTLKSMMNMSMAIMTMPVMTRTRRIPVMTTIDINDRNVRSKYCIYQHCVLLQL